MRHGVVYGEKWVSMRNKSVNLHFGRRLGRLRRLFIPPGNFTRTVRLALDEKAIVVRGPHPKVRENWGDKLNPILVNHISDRTVYNDWDCFNAFDRQIYSVIGSNMQSIRHPNVVVWGTGYNSYNARPLVQLSRVCAVRGPLSRKICLENGIDCPEIFGDPALLAPYFLTPSSKKTHLLGIIPHMSDQKEPVLEYFRCDARVKIIDICSGIQKVVDEITSCEYIASSALHGLIAADAYGVPSLWLRLSDNPSPDLFKYDDYYASIGYGNQEPLRNVSEYSVSQLVGRCTKKDIEVDFAALLGACPFLNRRKTGFILK